MSAWRLKKDGDNSNNMLVKYKPGTSFPGVIGRTAGESSPAWPAPLRAKEGAPNVLFIALDDTGFGQLGCYGSPINTPNINRLAENGLRYTNTHTPGKIKNGDTGAAIDHYHRYKEDVDFVGVNVYIPLLLVKAANQPSGYEEAPFSLSNPKMFSDWRRLVPESQYWSPRLPPEIWKPKEIYITENGCAANDKVAPDGNVYDSDRIMRQGTAITEATFGATNPVGNPPFTLPRRVGQMPIHHAQPWGSGYRRTATDIHKGYLDMPSTPLFPFGHGLSYTTFDYSPLKLESAEVDAGGEFRAAVTIKNSGRVRGTEVVRLYAADTATGMTLPARQLIGFARVDLEPGASKNVSFAAPLSVLAYTGVNGELVMEPGPIEVSVGGGSNDIRQTANLDVTGKTRSIKGEERAFLSAATVGPACI
jgi:hypothetical protein